MIKRLCNNEHFYVHSFVHICPLQLVSSDLVISSNYPTLPKLLASSLNDFTIFGCYSADHYCEGGVTMVYMHPFGEKFPFSEAKQWGILSSEVRFIGLPQILRSCISLERTCLHPTKWNRQPLDAIETGNVGLIQLAYLLSSAG
jgi:hypothetical protein